MKRLSWFNIRKRKFDFDEVAGKLELENVRKDVKTKGLELSDLLKKEREPSNNLGLDRYSPVMGQILILLYYTLLFSISDYCYTMRMGQGQLVLSSKHAITF